jgi:hypothetical protein
MREIVSVNTGQCGLEAGAQFYEQIAEEHGLDPHTGVCSDNQESYQKTRLGTFFREIEGL